jgi:hypothetical protein
MRTGLVCLVALLLALPASAGETIYRGIDTWSTPADGATYTDFASHPIPAGFFCAGSRAFTGKVALHGVPIATATPGELGVTDTIVERLDDAAFNGSGMAVTRLQLRSLNLASIAPVQTDCGAYNVRVALAGTQPTTRMRIYKDDDHGGRFLAPLAVNVKLTFTPVLGGAGHELMQQVHFAADPRAPWSFERGKSLSRSGWVQVDSDGNGVPDLWVRGASNFTAGRRTGVDKYAVCHEAGDGSMHCTNLCSGCQIP